MYYDFIFFNVILVDIRAFSLISVPTAVVSVSGSRWDLDQTNLNLGGRALHNEVGPSGEVTITCHSGKLALMRGKFRFPHD